jgi:hypothetical protein
MNAEADTVAMSMPLFIRLLEFAREDAISDLDLHFVAENAMKLLHLKPHLTMEDYNALMMKA